MVQRGPEAVLRRVPSAELGPAEVEHLRTLFDAAFGSDVEDRFTEHDWEHALGGTHFVLELDGRIVTHAALVERTLEIDGQPVHTGYVEAVATAGGHEGRGFGSRVVSAVNEAIRDRYELGALGTGRHHFYARLGWETWAGPLFVRTSDGPRRTPDDDGYLMVLRTPTSPSFETTASISCDLRSGDVW